jgi:hypothetical protein
MNDNDGFIEAYLPAQPGQVIGKTFDGIVLFRLIALAMAPPVNGNNPMIAPEIVELGR